MIAEYRLGFYLLMIQYFRQFLVAYQGISFTDIQDETDADPVTVDATNAVFELPAGTYDLSLEFYGNQGQSFRYFSCLV